MTSLVTSITPEMYTEIARRFDIVNGVLVEEHQGARKGSSIHFRNENRHVLLANRSNTVAPEDDACRYDFYASEKTFRLCGHKEHTLSWQSRNEELGQFQGAGRFKRVGVIGSISGFTGEEDESGILWIGSGMGWMTGPEAYQAAQISRNSRYNDLVQKFNEAERLKAA